MQVFSSSTFASFFASLYTVTGVNEARLVMITPFIRITKKTEWRKRGSVAGGRGSSSEEFQRGTVLLGNTEHYFIHLVLRVICVLHVFRRSHSPHLITGRDVVVLDEAVIILLIHRRLSVAPGTLLRRKLNLKAWEANIKKGLLENVNKSHRSKDNWLPILCVCKIKAMPFYLFKKQVKKEENPHLIIKIHYCMLLQRCSENNLFIIS